MDFEISEWNVPSDVNRLTEGLFGKLHKIKKKKIKPQDSQDIHPKHYQLNKEKVNVDDKYKIGIISKLERKKQKMQKRKLQKLIVNDKGHRVSASEDNCHPSVKRKCNEMGFAMEYSDILPRKKARTYVNPGLLAVDTEKYKSDNSDRNENENLKREKQSEYHAIDFKENPERKKRKKRSKKNKFKVESPVKIDDHLRSLASEEGFSTNKKNATNQSLSEITKKSLDVDVENKTRKKKKRKKSKQNNFKADSDQKNDKQITSSTAVLELNSNMKESNSKCFTASVPKKNEINPRINRNEVGQRLFKSSDTSFSDKPSKSHKNSPFNVEKLNNILENKHAVTNASKVNFSDKGSSNKQYKQSKNEPPSSSVTLKEKMLERLSAARFRYLNEQLYTTTGGKAFDLFQEDADSFAVYHAGFQGQVEKWPTNPVDLIIRFIMSRPKHLIIADFGCGDAKIARSVPNKVYSFDLVALNDLVTVCNMAKVPLNNSSVDIAVFCLSLMGTNLADYIREAHRVLKNGGILKIAEVQSRFQDLGAFVKKVEMLGFRLTDQDAENKMFIMIDFKKSKPAKSQGSNIQLTLHPCIYKKR